MNLRETHGSLGKGLGPIISLDGPIPYDAMPSIDIENWGGPPISGDELISSTPDLFDPDIVIRKTIRGPIASVRSDGSEARVTRIPGSWGEMSWVEGIRVLDQCRVLYPEIARQEVDRLRSAGLPPAQTIAALFSLDPKCVLSSSCTTLSFEGKPILLITSARLDVIEGLKKGKIDDLASDRISDEESGRIYEYNITDRPHTFEASMMTCGILNNDSDRPRQRDILLHAVLGLKFSSVDPLVLHSMFEAEIASGRRQSNGQLPALRPYIRFV